MRSTSVARAVVVPVAVLDPAEAVEAAVDVPRVRVVAPGRPDQRVLDVRLGVVDHDERAQAQIRIVRQVGRAAVVVHDPGDTAEHVGHAVGRAVAVGQHAAVGIRQRRRPHGVGAAVGVGVLDFGSRRRVHGPAVRLVIRAELAEVIVA